MNDELSAIRLFQRGEDGEPAPVIRFYEGRQQQAWFVQERDKFGGLSERIDWRDVPEE